MPPKKNATRKGAAALSQEDQFQSDIRSFSQTLKMADKTKGYIKVPKKTLGAINKLLQAYRAQERLLDQDCVYDFVGSLEGDEGDNICKHLSPEAFSTTLQVILQMVVSKEAERGLYLLAASIFQISQDFDDADEFLKKKDVIGTSCLGQLLRFFVDSESSYGMQRWVGLLCIQLVTGCERNHSKVEQMTEDVRRSIGRLVVEEGDELLRVIYALLVRAMTDQGTEISAMYPEDFEPAAFAHFPLSSQETTGWGIRFQDYLDNVFNKTALQTPAQVGELMFTASVILTPGGQLGAKHHNNMLFVDDLQLTFLATCRDGHFDSILEIPRSSIKSITTVPDHESQTNAHRMALNILGNGDIFDGADLCFLDSQAIRLTTVTFSIELFSMQKLLRAVREGQDSIEVFSLNGSQIEIIDNSQTTRPIDNVTLGDSQARPQNTSQAALGETNDDNDLHGSQKVLGGTLGHLSQIQSAQLDDAASVTNAEETAMETAKEIAIEDPHEDNEDDLYSASPKTTQRRIASPETRPAIVKPITARGRRIIKSKAKRPIDYGRSSLKSQLANKKSQVTQANSNEDDHTQGQKIKAGAANDGSTAAKPAADNTSTNKAVNGGTNANTLSRGGPQAPGADSSTTKSHKKYGLHKPTDDPSKGEDDPITKLKNTNKSATTNLTKSKAKAPEPQFGTKTKIDAKKRQSAPAAVPPRHSQRAAASKAKTKMQGANDSYYENEVEDMPSIKLKLKATKAKQKHATSKSAKMVKPKMITTLLGSPCVSEDQDTHALQAEDARSMGLTPDESAIEDQDEEENPYNTSPKQPSKKAGPPAKMPKEATAPKDARNSGIDLAIKLADSLEAILSSDPERIDELPAPVPRKTAALRKVGAGSQVAPKEQLSPDRSNEIQAIDDHDEAGTQADVEVDDQNQLTVEQETPLHMHVDDIAVSSPIALIPDDLTAPTVSLSIPSKRTVIDSSSPALHDIIETEQKTRLLIAVVQDLSNHTIAVQNSKNSLTIAKKNGDDGALEQVTITELSQVEVVEVAPKKRKTPTEKHIGMKRRRVEEESTPVAHGMAMQPEPSQNLVSVSKISGELDPSSPIPNRRSPRLAAKSIRLQAEPISASPRVPSAIKDPSRKPQVISFSSKGPQNQGMGSAGKPKDKVAIVQAYEVESSVNSPIPDRKRKRDKANLSKIVSPFKKKLNSSPFVDRKENDDPVEPGSNSESRVMVKYKSTQQRQMSGRPSSQGSRVDRNGSPIAADIAVDHIRKLKEALASDQVKLDPRVSGNGFIVVTEPDEEKIFRARRASEIFGPKIALGNKSKQRPSSPGEPNTRYILHGESQGVYTDFDTKKIVEEKKVLVDPFTEGGRRSSGFIDRLQGSTLKERAAAKSKSTSTIDPRDSKVFQNIPTEKGRLIVEEELPELPREKRILNRGRHEVEAMPQQQRARRNVTAVSSPSDMTSGTSYASHSSDVARTPLQEVEPPNDTWNLAVRPHYNTFNLALHRIHEEVIVRLVGEEDRMDLLVDQYKENGTKMLDNLKKKREVQRGVINRNLKQKKTELASVYAESRGEVMKTEQSMREESTSDFEVNWRRNQNAIRKKISDCRKSSE
ncbi:uncharacterized protein RSE6_10744 [Rhynchosporium secalis]|uniref:Uncharacterized protein n=1 Tax=Rhynchosporium secalis TaxID=38038 RepID=A0A1E1ML89_RHYSE|nr:uncharacterized protein RSE6_10744 [Rhynchosporium secalis]